MLGIERFRLVIASRETKHCACDLVLSFSGKLADGIEGRFQKLGHYREDSAKRGGRERRDAGYALPGIVPLGSVAA